MQEINLPNLVASFNEQEIDGEALVGFIEEPEALREIVPRLGEWMKLKKKLQELV